MTDPTDLITAAIRYNEDEIPAEMRPVFLDNLATLLRDAMSYVQDGERQWPTVNVSLELHSTKPGIHITFGVLNIEERSWNLEARRERIIEDIMDMFEQPRVVKVTCFLMPAMSQTPG